MTDWKSLRDTLPRVKGLSDRAFRITALEAVLDGEMYDSLAYPFSQELTESFEYIPLDKRRPSVRTHLCRVVVEDSVSLLFSEAHWPPVYAKNTATIEALTKITKRVQLNEVMLEAATRGSVGSVAIWLKIIKNQPFFEVLSTAYLTPAWEEENPEELNSITELRLVTGLHLEELGYTVADGDMKANFWFRRIWDKDNEDWFVPVKASKVSGNIKKFTGWVRDDDRSVTHKLGFCPMIWIRNLPTTIRRDLYDGACTFEPAIDTVIEADYLLSQGGRALKYAADPTLVIKQGSSMEAPTRVGGASRALSIDSDGDAKLLEINGSAAKAVNDHVIHLRSIALEAIHGNRANADRLSAATSGRSIELMMAGLIALADRLRISYGEGGLLRLLRMMCRASKEMTGGLVVAGETFKDIDETGLELRWPAWMPALPRDVLEGAQALVTAVEGNVISLETAIARFGAMINVDDATDEFNRVMAQIQEERAEEDRVAKRDASLGPSPSAKPNGGPAKIRQDANKGVRATRDATA